MQNEQPPLQPPRRVALRKSPISGYRRKAFGASWGSLGRFSGPSWRRSAVTLKMMAADNDDAYNLSPGFILETVEAARGFVEKGENLRTGTEKRWGLGPRIGTFLGWSVERVELALAQLGAIGRKELSREAKSQAGVYRRGRKGPPRSRHPREEGREANAPAGRARPPRGGPARICRPFTRQQAAQKNPPPPPPTQRK